MGRFGDMLRIYLAAKNISMRDFAKYTGISLSTISRICSGEEFETKTLLKLLNWMLEDKANPIY